MGAHDGLSNGIELPRKSGEGHLLCKEGVERCRVERKTKTRQYSRSEKKRAAEVSRFGWIEDLPESYNSNHW
ncbi:conserved hypothetical protein [Ricinus communis]|uniref:Uncharacterized protein n=1 Tax=Ricinus communis TaxID=3988 RepID=B9SRY2_RICCO|nr:conserved hypothetical protein [Ricinus communis]